MGLTIFTRVPDTIRLSLGQDQEQDQGQSRHGRFPLCIKAYRSKAVAGSGRHVEKQLLEAQGAKLKDRGAL